MSNILLLFRPKSDTASLSWGSWRSSLPLSNVTDPRLSRVARSSNAALTSTRMRVSLPQVQGFRALVLGPMNVTQGYKYRIRSYSNPGFNNGPVSDTGWVQPTTGPSGDALELEWEDPNFWLGIVPFADEERGIYLIHVFATQTFGQYWSFEIDNQFNPDGYVQIGRLFMADWWMPSVNYGYGDNNLTFGNNSLVSQALGGSKSRYRRVNPRVFRLGLDFLQETEGFDEAYDFMRYVGYDREVFVIPDPDDAESIQARSFLGTINQMNGLSQTMFQILGTGFEIEESLV